MGIRISFENSFLLRINNEADEDALAEIIDERTAKILKYPLRITPPGQKRVDELVFRNDVIRTNYGTGGKVVNVSPYKVYGLTVYSITFVHLDTTPNKDGGYRDSDLLGINECVAQDGRILHLFMANNDEVFMERTGTGQQSMLRHWG